MTIDEIIESLKDTGLPGDTVVYVSIDDREMVEVEEVSRNTIGTLENPIKVVTIY